MSAPYAGACACGRVTATIAGEPVAVRQCWCRQCQQLSAGSPSANAIFAVADVALFGGLANHGWTAASGNTLTTSFCAACGTPVMAQSSARPQFRTIRLGFLSPDHGLAPEIAIWTDEAPAWASIDPALPQEPASLRRQPPGDRSRLPFANHPGRKAVACGFLFWRWH